MNNTIKKLKKHFSKKTVKSKVGATLTELIAVVCILSIVSTTCISGLFAMADVAKRGQDLSLCERTSDMVSKQLSIYGNTANYVDSYNSKPTLEAYSETARPNGFMDADNGVGNKNDYFLYADASNNYRLILAKFDATPGSSGYQLNTIVSIDNVKSIKFDLKQLNTDETKYILQYTVTTVGSNVWNKATDKRVEYTISSGVVLNNTNNSTPSIPTPLTNSTITTKTPTTAATSTYIRIRTTSRSDVDIS